MAKNRVDINKGKAPVQPRKTASSRPVSNHRPFLDSHVYKGKGHKANTSQKHSTSSRRKTGRGNQWNQGNPSQPIQQEDGIHEDYAQTAEMVSAPMDIVLDSVSSMDTIQADDSVPYDTHTDPLPLIFSDLVTPPLPDFDSKNDVVIQPRIAYTPSADRPLVLESVLVDLWDVQWEHPVRIKWGCKWLWHRCEVQLVVKDSRHDQTGSALWMAGDFVLMAEGSSLDDPIIRHETVLIPFTSTILRPSPKLPKAELIHHPQLPPFPNNVWVQTSDWHITWVESPSGRDRHVEHGVLCITGRVWWFQKQLLPLVPSQPNTMA